MTLQAYLRTKVMLCWLAAFLFAATNAYARDASFVIESARTKDIDAVYYLDADATLVLSDAQEQALQSGLTLAIEVVIFIEENYWRYFYSDVAELEQRYLIQYHALTDQYLFTTINSGLEYAYDSLSAGLTELGKFRNLPLIDRSLLDETGRHRVRMKAQVDVESLPLTLRPFGYFTQRWGTESDWLVWPLEF